MSKRFFESNEDLEVRLRRQKEEARKSNTLEMAAVALSSAADDLMKSQDLKLVRLQPADRSVAFSAVLSEVRMSLEGRQECRPLILGLFVKYLSQCVRDASRR